MSSNNSQKSNQNSNSTTNSNQKSNQNSNSKPSSNPNQVFNFRDISDSDLQQHFQIGDFTNSDPSRESKETPTYKGAKLRFTSPWLYCRFGWGGQYNTISLSTYANRSFPLDDDENNDDKKTFRQFLFMVETQIRAQLLNSENPDKLSYNLVSPITFDEKFNTYKFQFPIPKSHLNGDGEFEGQVFKSTDYENPEFAKSSLKDIQPKSYISFVGHIGKITQNKTNVRYRVVIEQIHWMPVTDAHNEEAIGSETNLFLNVPKLSKRKVTGSLIEQNVDIDYNEYNDLSQELTTKKTKV